MLFPLNFNGFGSWHSFHSHCWSIFWLEYKKKVRLTCIRFRYFSALSCCFIFFFFSFLSKYKTIILKTMPKVNNESEKKRNFFFDLFLLLSQKQNNENTRGRFVYVTFVYLTNCRKNRGREEDNNKKISRS